MQQRDHRDSLVDGVGVGRRRQRDGPGRGDDVHDDEPDGRDDEPDGGLGPLGTGAASASKATATATATASGPKGCALSQLAVTTSPSDGGDSHSGVILEFRDSGAACTLVGYPGVDTVSASGAVLGHATRTPSGYLGGVRSGKYATVALAHGGTASALLEWDAGTDSATCSNTERLHVTPPNNTSFVTVAHTIQDCENLQIHPVVAGTTGNAG